MSKLIQVETKLQFREWATVTFGLLFPAALLLLLGFVIPGFRDVDPELGGNRLIDLYTPIMLVLVLVMVGISSSSSVLTTYRHDGILRRLRTTPVGPSRMLAAQMVAHLIVAGLGMALAVVVALSLLGVPAPASWPATILAVPVTAAALFSIGLLIGATAPSTSAAHAISTVVWLPLMVLAGLWFPREVMPEQMRRISDLSPGGAGVDAVQQAWFGSGVPLSNLTVLAVFTLVTGGLAAVTFRWE